MSKTITATLISVSLLTSATAMAQSRSDSDTKEPSIECVDGDCVLALPDNTVLRFPEEEYKVIQERFEGRNTIDPNDPWILDPCYGWAREHGQDPEVYCHSDGGGWGGGGNDDDDFDMCDACVYNFHVCAANANANFNPVVAGAIIAFQCTPLLGTCSAIYCL